MKRIAIVAALEREIGPLLRRGGFKRVRLSSRAGDFTTFQDDRVILVCGGIGGVAATAAAKVLLDSAGGAIGVVVSAGLAGALTPDLRVGDVFYPAEIVSEDSEKRLATSAGKGTLVSVGEVSGREQKRRLYARHQAEAADMEAYAVADLARVLGYPFLAVKAISDELDFPMPPLSQFVDEAGNFQTVRFAFYAGVRPRLWPVVTRLRANSNQAAVRLCEALSELVEGSAANRLDSVSGAVAGSGRLQAAQK